MNQYSTEFYDLLSRAIGGSSAVLLQGFLDEVMAQKYNTLQLDGFDWAPDMQMDFTYEQVQRELSLNVMASYVDKDSPAIPVSPDELTIHNGRIPRMKMVEYLNEDKIRKQIITEQRFGANSDRVIASAAETLFVTLDKLIGGHTNSLTYQRHQMVSTGGLTLTDVNNPQGIQNVTFSAHVPAANKTVLSGTSKWWTNNTYTTEGSGANPIADLKDIVEKARKKGVKGHFEVNDSYLSTILSHKAVRTALATRLFPTSTAEVGLGAVTYADRNTLIDTLGLIAGAPIKAIDSLVSVEKYDATAKKIVKENIFAFEKDVIVFVPDGTLGEVLTVEPIAIAGGTYANFYGGRLLVTVGMDAVKKCQSYNTEMTSLVVPEVPQYFWYLYPNNS